MIHSRRRRRHAATTGVAAAGPLAVSAGVLRRRRTGMKRLVYLWRQRDIQRCAVLRTWACAAVSRRLLNSVRYDRGWRHHLPYWDITNLCHRRWPYNAFAAPPAAVDGHGQNKCNIRIAVPYLCSRCVVLKQTLQWLMLLR